MTDLKLYDLQCKQCGKPFQYHNRRLKLCSDECRQAAIKAGYVKRERAKGVLPWDERKALERAKAITADCIVCGVTFRAKLGGTGKRATTCSKACMGVAQRKYQTEDERKKAWRRFKAAQAEIRRIFFVSLKRREAEARIAKLAVCPDCGTIKPSEAVKPNQYALKPCPACKAQRVKEQRKADKAVRRARKKAAPYERVYATKVFERDGWRCHICGRKTLKNKRGTWHDKAPELDHIIPLSKGGPHTYGNVACACRACNGKKGNMILGQPSLLTLM
jgi:5-methylcytosine-specific restriction endonuclease McrA